MVVKTYKDMKDQQRFGEQNVEYGFGVWVQVRRTGNFARYQIQVTGCYYLARSGQLPDPGILYLMCAILLLFVTFCVIAHSFF